MKNPTWAAIVRELNSIRQNPNVQLFLFINGICTGLNRAWKILKALGELLLTLLALPLLLLVVVVISFLPKGIFVERAAQSFDALLLPTIKLVALAGVAVVLGIGLWSYYGSRRSAIVRA